MQKVMYHFVNEVESRELYDPDDKGVVRLNKVLNHYADRGWRVVRLEQADYGLKFWILFEREVINNVGR